MMPTPRHRTFADDVDVDRLHVFVPGILGAGILISIGILLADLVGRLRGDRGTRRRQALVARTAAVAVLRAGGAPVEGPAVVGTRSRRAYLLAGASWLALGLYVTVGSFWNYWNPEDEFRGWAWLWAGSWLVAATFVWVGVVAVTLAIHWPRAPWWCRSLIRRTPLGQPPQR
jgi:hypothetical protein